MARRAFLVLALLATFATPGFALAHEGDWKLDAVLLVRAHAPRGAAASRVIIQTADGLPADQLIRSLHGKAGRRLGGILGQVAEIPDYELDALAAHRGVRAVSLDRRVSGTLERTGATIGATWVREHLRVDGSGVSVAIIDSGVASWHDDLNPQHILRFVDFVEFRTSAYDDYGHGTHVAGIIAGTGYDSGGARMGIAPGANLVVLKVLDGDGFGYISNVIAALDYAVQHRVELRIRVINLSVAAGVYESYTTDPLTLAAKRAVEAGIVVITAAGNFGRDAGGGAQYRRRNGPRERTVGPDRRGVQPQRHHRACGRFDRAVQLAGTDRDRLRGQTGHRRTGRRHRVADRSRDAALHGASRRPVVGHGRHGDASVSQPERHQHGRACRRRHCRADDPGQSFSHPEPRQGHPPVHGRASRVD